MFNFPAGSAKSPIADQTNKMSPYKSDFSGQPADRQGQKSITTTTTTMTPGLRGSGSIMDIAVAATSPEGLPIGLLPLYKIVHGMILKKGQYDISSLTAKAVIAVGAVIGIKLVWDWIGPKLVDTLTTSVTIPVEHQKAKDIQSWLESRPSSAASRHTKFRVGSLKFNKATQTHQLGGERQAATGGGWYLFNGQPLYIQYIEQPKAEPQNGNAPVQRVWANDNNDPGVDVSGDTIRVFSLGFSNVLDRFLEHASGRQKVATKDTTVVFEVTPRSGSERRRYGGEDWSERIRPARPLSTIDLDQEVKDDLVNDIERFLQPKREKWYGCRGIPYRRGYLLFGEPGTGKSSMSAAIAAKVGGNLYQASMNEIADEAHLRRLFTSPEKGDVLLLEDIDSAGISREKMKVQVEEVKEGSKDDKSIESVKTFEPKRGNISLSGLLNAIDGLPDGVILIMTSNTPETLDKALIRPGRIDKQVLFGHVSEAVTECIFKRMYQDDEDDVSPNTEVDDLAKTFASRIPENRLTPAEVQGFLIPRATPDQALADVDQWVEELLEAKANGKNIVGVEGEFMESQQSRNHHKSDDEDSGVDGFSNDSEYDDY